ncbi:uncharacterized protein N7446_013620 [Penicillium canescens]|uniref:RNase MRP protein 1 RNA binding domain-containing protein n=1 Tax=Penicillium canescens TaxID=5083 RepID=A0AAD6N2K4_PENCN|nr:uncharacterized protein N7446_013620 [Penicillium canescens]KAJ6023261.1 hypothetical protein N7460_013656 [Penicillium canescens]KAJ6025469.1 hypothetical protein N7444_013148 [Penicillium canescens]KAJ6042554.1 hypothetical protein N7446_013620 [Penicillium canescens]
MDSQEILAIHSILHLIFHRNKNQHRGAKWWKWLSALKRATLDLARSGAQAHLAHIVPRCYVAFSTVVADNRFSSLGVVLLATLARLSKVTGISQELKTQPGAIRPKNTGFVAKEDLGERVIRVDEAPLVKPVEISRPESVPEPAETDSKRAKPKKSKKKKKNAIDDLFNGLF